MKNIIKIVIADDHMLVAQGISHLIEKDFRCCGIARSIADAADKLKTEHPDVLLLDVAFPDGDGIDAIPLLREACPETRILMLTIYAEAAVIQRALNAGADGYLLKSTDREELLKAITTVIAGETFICKEAQAIVFNQGEKVVRLTPREREILHLLVEGYSIKEMADKLCLSFETIHTYTKYLRQKLCCNNTASLVRKAIEQHLI